MQITLSNPSDTEAALVISADEKTLSPIKDKVLEHMKHHVDVPGFRKGKVPPAMVEKHANQELLQSEFLNEAINQLYRNAVLEKQLRVVANPEVSVSKFVPFTQLEFEAKVPIISNVKLADYKKIKKTKPPVKVVTKDIDEVIGNLQLRLAEKKDVNRAAKDTDQVWIDFKGVDEKGQPVKGADGKDYPLSLGSNTFIPGFEANLVGLKAGQEKTFTLTFPKDYGVKALANRKVTFTVNVTKVQEVILPEVNDEFAAKVGPFKTVKELKDDIKKQLTIERQQEVDREFESELVLEIAKQSKVSLPQVMIDEQVERLMGEHRQNLTYRGQTIAEFLEAEGTTEDKFKKEVLEPQARERVTAGVILSEIAEAENLEVNQQELDIRLSVLRGQYSDPQMQAELDKPESQRDIASRMLTEKTIAKLVSYATQQ